MDSDVKDFTMSMFATKEDLYKAKYESFLKDLGDLCKKYDVTLTPSGYDCLQVWEGVSNDWKYSEITTNCLGVAQDEK